MSYLDSFDISLSGMDFHRTQLDIIAMNLANVNTTRTAGGGPYQPLAVVGMENIATNFDSAYVDATSELKGVTTEVLAQALPGKSVYEPSHPDADERGYVLYPDINPVTEMVNLMQSKHAYEANVKVINASRAMAMYALDISGRS